MRTQQHFTAIFYVCWIICSCFACNSSTGDNHLANASSPYLREHADNPVNWYEWGDEALAVAKKENKPLLISIGYSSCHWCHVMEKESFMDTSVARIMNESFINIKVDREERPDIDNIYMNACQLITGGGGWPLNAFALPDGKPFFAGTYYSKERWKNLLTEIAKAYREKNDIVRKQAEELTREIARNDLVFPAADSQSTSMSKSGYQQIFDSVYVNIDLRNGGLKRAPKFPMPAVNEFLLQYYSLTGDQRALSAVNTTLTKMALGGIYDQVGGGFARYATDTLWKVPHFEKMLYDNGQLLSLYAHAYQLTKNDFFKRVLQETAGFIDRELRAPGGGYFSSLNADSGEGEGEFYVWTQGDVKKLLGQQSGTVTDYYQLTPEGNWEKGKNLLQARLTPEEFAREKNIDVAVFVGQLASAKSKLITERNKRPRPSIDTKVLTAWNAITVKGYADAFAATGESSYLDKAVDAAGFLEKKLMNADGSLSRNFKDGATSINGFLDDYAWMARASIRLYQVTFEKKWLDLADRVTRYAVKNFYDEKTGMFFYTGTNLSGLVVRKMETADEVIPSSNAIMAMVLYELSVYFENDDYLKKCSGMLSKIAGKMNRLTSYYAQWAYLGGYFSHGTYEVAIMGKDAASKNLQLQQHFLPKCIFLGGNEENLPLLENKLPDGSAMIYVCTNRTCKRPVEEVEKALTQLK